METNIYISGQVKVFIDFKLITIILSKAYRKIVNPIILLLFLTTSIFLNAQTTKTVGGTGANYSTLKAAFDAINAGTIHGVIILQITGSTTESSSAKLNASGSGSASYSSLTIYPTVFIRALYIL